MNAFDDFHHNGFTESRKAEFIRRYLIVDALELCTSDVIQFLIDFGADLAKEYDGIFVSKSTIRIYYESRYFYDISWSNVKHQS